MTSERPENGQIPPVTIAPALVDPTFVLLFSLNLKSAFQDFGFLPEGTTLLPLPRADDYLARLATLETRLLGRTFRAAGRLRRVPLGRIVLDGLTGDAPHHADIYLLAHTSQVALWEVWLPAPSQRFDAGRWIGWLDAESEDGLIAQLWRTLGPVTAAMTGAPTWTGLYFCVTCLYAPHDTLDALIERHGADFVHLLFLDRGRRAFKARLVTEELNRDYCAHEGGMTLLGRRSGLDVHGCNDLDREAAADLPPRHTLPFLITLELLLIERAVLARLYRCLSVRMPESVEELLTLKQEVLDALEEYYGAITNATRFSDAITTDGERLLDLDDLYDAVMDRLDAVSFTITTRYQKRMTLLQFWLTVVLGATEIGFIASGIAIWYYRQALVAVLGWTVGASVVSGLILVLVLRGRLE